MNHEPKIKPGRWIYVPGGIVFALGMAMTLYGLASFISVMFGTDEGLQQIKAPGKATIKVDKPGAITIYQEWKTAFGQQPRNAGAARRNMTCVVTDSAGKNVVVVPANSSETYKRGDRGGISVWKFDAPAAGNYELDIQTPSEMQGEFDVAVGPSLFSGSMKQMLTFYIGIFGGGILDALGIALIIIGLVMRSRSKHRQQKVG